MANIINAQAILKEKGFVQNKFDTNGFMNAVADFFIENNVESRLLLIPFRFLDIQREIIKGTNVEYNKYNPFDVTRDEERLGYKVQTTKNKYGELEYARSMINYDFEAYQNQQKAGLVVPRIIVDKPFFENAAGLLRVMAGYIVEKQMKKRTKLYWVTLV